VYNMPSSIAGSIAAPLVGAVAGKFLGGSGEKQSSSSMPVLPDNLKKGYDSLIEGAMAQYQKPFTPALRGRVEAPTTGMEALFSSPEMLQIQRMSDANSYLNSVNPTSTSTTQTQQPVAQIDRAGLINKAFAGAGNRGNVYNQFLAKATDQDYTDLNNALTGATQDAYGWTKGGQRVDLGSILNKYARG
jgi:hypothetical protein